MKILFLEDRPSRQIQFLPHGEKDVEKLSALEGVFMPKSKDCRDIIGQINQASYIFDTQTELIIVHKSSLITEGLQYLSEFCEQNEVKLICFSGGISQLIYTNEGFEFMNMNSVDFYSERLIPFIERFVAGESETLLELASDNFKLSYLLTARQLIGSIELEQDGDAKFNLQEKLNAISKVLNLEFEVKRENLERINSEVKKIIIQA
ncbi:MAG TPA: hypothetical protein PK047_09060 [Saprospiraceae bacterium]|nr:hypothetical protein [Saprospiraceae bacterium]HRO09004.1 hypothetical protein [Saprospiraceae bacterium]HRP42262.1 hypothetical protein [Saprospiraceae bacterium]